jgi:hypothetical protein
MVIKQVATENGGYGMIHKSPKNRELSIAFHGNFKLSDGKPVYLYQRMV